MTWLLIPLFLLLAILIVFGIFIFLARFRKGRYLRPIIMQLSRIPWMKRQFQKVSQAAIEKENPELASAMRKIQRLGPNADMKKMQQAYQSLTPQERRAYQEMADQQGVGTPEATNRQMRRAQQRLTQTNRGGSGSTSPSSNSSSSSKRKKR